MSRYVIKQFAPKDWFTISESAHAAAFGELRPASVDRIDFALLTVEDKTDTVVGYVTCTEINAFILNWKFGGAFPPIRGKASLLSAYRATIEWCAKGTWTHLTTLIKNDNFPSLRLAMSVGFKIIGIHYFEGEILVELSLKMTKES